MHRSLTIVIPCYNEAARFPLEIFRTFVLAHSHIHFLLVNDGSTDNTLLLLRETAAIAPDRITVLDQPVNGGKSEAVRRGMLAALDRPGCEAAGYWDADMATPLEQIDDMANVLFERPERMMVFGARVKLLGRDVDRKAVRHYLGRVFATVVSLVLRLAIYDTQCGAKLFRVSNEIRHLFSTPFASRWVFDVEILARFIQCRNYEMRSIEAAIYEFPLPRWRDVAGSRLRAQDFLRAFFDVLGIYRRYRQH